MKNVVASILVLYSMNTFALISEGGEWDLAYSNLEIPEELKISCDEFRSAISSSPFSTIQVGDHLEKKVIDEYFQNLKEENGDCQVAGTRIVNFPKKTRKIDLRYAEIANEGHDLAVLDDKELMQQYFLGLGKKYFPEKNPKEILDHFSNLTINQGFEGGILKDLYTQMKEEADLGNTNNTALLKEIISKIDSSSDIATEKFASFFKKNKEQTEDKKLQQLTKVQLQNQLDEIQNKNVKMILDSMPLIFENLKLKKQKEYECKKYLEKLKQQQNVNEGTFDTFEIANENPLIQRVMKNLLSKVENQTEVTLSKNGPCINGGEGIFYKDEVLRFNEQKNPQLKSYFLEQKLPLACRAFTRTKTITDSGERPTRFVHDERYENSGINFVKGIVSPSDNLNAGEDAEVERERQIAREQEEKKRLAENLKQEKENSERLARENERLKAENERLRKENEKKDENKN